ncbi:hypothetical protein GGR50DRAFT_679877 [Xylaria sp. CBS 124048]|nr:hypothetical protein GGR50DRAFT_679877 [Xylaria sp. CBS 124048]
MVDLGNCFCCCCCCCCLLKFMELFFSFFFRSSIFSSLFTVEPMDDASSRFSWPSLGFFFLNDFFCSLFSFLGGFRWYYGFVEVGSGWNSCFVRGLSRVCMLKPGDPRN